MKVSAYLCTFSVTGLLAFGFASTELRACGEFEAGGLDALRMDPIDGLAINGSAQDSLSRGISHFNAGQLDLADDAFREANARAKSARQPKIEASALINLANLLMRQNKLKQAEKYFTKSLSLTRKSRSWRLTSKTYYNLGILHKERGDLREAVSMYRLGLDTIRSRKAPELHTATLNNLGNILREQGKFKRAERILKHSLSLAEHHGLSEKAKQAAVNLAKLYREDYGMNGSMGLAWRRSISPSKQTSTTTFRRAF